MSVLKNQSPFWSKPSLERSFSFVVIWYCTTISFSGVLLKKLFTWPLLWANNFRFKLWGLSWVILLFFQKRDFYLQWNKSRNLCTSPISPWYLSSSPTFEDDTIIITYSLMTHPGTMLQKLSKCEVKAWLFWNLIIFPPLRFYMISNFGEFKWSKNVIYGNFRDAELWILVNLGLESCSNLQKIKIQNL